MCECLSVRVELCWRRCVCLTFPETGCNMLQCIAVCCRLCCSVLQCIVVCCSVLQCVAACCSV